MDHIEDVLRRQTRRMAEILSGARKYRIGLTLAHHELHQLRASPEVASAVLTHPYTRIVFRVGDDDAKKLAEGFSYFEAKDLRNLETGHAIVRVERSDFDFNLIVPLPDVVDKPSAMARRQAVITRSRAKYGTARAEVAAMLAKSRATPEPSPGSPPPKPVESQPAVAPTPLIIQSPPVMEAPKAATPPAAMETVVSDAVPLVAVRKDRDLGKGGAQHKAIQRRIKEAAEALNFRSVIEQQIGGGQESVDLWLERGDQKIACEISISTTIDHEVGNVAKCLKAGYPKAAVICVDEDRLQKIAAAVAGSLGVELATRVSYHLPDQFIADLKAIPKPVETNVATVSKHRGITIKRSYSKLTMEEQKQREEITCRAMRETMQTRYSIP